MAYLNNVTLIGNLGKDPETRTISEGNNVTNFSLATTKRYTKDGEKKEITTWHNISTFGKLADVAQKYLKKGASIYLQGEIRTDVWDKDGVKQYKTYVVADKIEFLSTKETEHTKTTEGKKLAPSSDLDADELPF